MKKVLIFTMSIFLTIASLSISSNMSIYAKESKEIADKQMLQIFIESIENSENKEIKESDILEYIVEDEVISVLVSEKDGNFKLYRSLSPEEQKTLQPSLKTKGVFKEIVGIVMKVIQGGKTVCKLVKAISGENVCSKIGQTLLNSLVPNVKYKAVSTLKKNPNCVPAHSQQCNTYPNVYWVTTVTKM